jgi:YidC/Oxa1 family membrane protein insertase
MDRNSIIGIVLIVLILVIFSIMNKPSQEEIDAAKRRQDSMELVRQQNAEQELIQQKILQEAVKADDSVAGTEDKTEELRDKYGSFAGAVEGENKFYVLENDLVRIQVAAKGGRIFSVQLKEYQTWDSMPLILFDGDNNYFGLNFFAQNRIISTNELFFKPEGSTSNLYAKDKPATLTMRLQAADNQYIDYEYTLDPESFMVQYNIRLAGMNNLIGANQRYIDLKWQIDVPGQEKGATNEKNFSTIYYNLLANEIDYLAERKDTDKEEILSRLKWIAFKQQFFSSVLIASDNLESALIEQVKFEEGDYIANFKAEIRLPYDNKADEVIPLSFYFGPNHYTTLRRLSKEYEEKTQFNLQLEKLVPLGWGIFGWVNRFLVIPVFNFLEKYIANYGIIILLLTIFIKILIYPLTYKSYISTSKMRVLKPQIDEINERIPKDKALERQQATMDLYKRAGVNPMGGCLPMLIQMPILFAMFRFFPTSFELRQESFLWATDLSSYDSILDLPFTIPFYGDHVSLFTLLMTISTVIYTKMNSQMTAGTSQMPGMQTMMYMMPIMFLFIFNSYASALSYYYFLANVTTFAQMAIIKRFVDDDAILKKLNENKKKPVKKSKFQTRLEEMAKQKGMNPKKK